MARLSFVATVLAVAATAAAQSSSIANPFTAAGIPSLSDLPFCQTECSTVAQMQSNWTGDYSSACTTSFATSLQTCMTCVIQNPIGAALLTPETEQQLSSALTSYEQACQQSGSPVTINLSSILSATATQTGTTTATSSTSTPSNTAGGADKAGLALGALVGVFGAAVALF